MKTAVYSWRLSDELKSNLERHARFRRVPVSTILEDAARDWLERAGQSDEDDQETQHRLHAAAEKCMGVVESAYPGGSERVRELVRDRVRRRIAR